MAAIAAVTTVPDSNPEAVNCAWFPPPPAARNTTIVSPIALETPMINAATKPEIAAGIVMRMVVVTRLAPSPAEASRSDLVLQLKHLRKLTQSMGQ